MIIFLSIKRMNKRKYYRLAQRLFPEGKEPSKEEMGF